MAEELQGLLERINKEGIEKIQGERDKALAEARREAQEILSKAKAEADAIIVGAKKDAAAAEQKGADTLKQAARDLMISLRGSVNKELEAVVSLEVGKALTPATMAQIIEKMLEAFASGGARPKGLDVLLSEPDRASLESLVLSRFKARLADGVNLRPVPEIEAGIKVGISGDNLFFDFTGEALTEMLCTYLNLRLAQLVKEATSQ